MAEPSSKRRKHSHDGSGNDEPSVAASISGHVPSTNSELNHDSTNGTAVTSIVKDAEHDATTQPTAPSAPLSKNQLKKLRKREEWEAGRDFRKAKRKEKIQERKVRKREEKHQAAEERRANGLNARSEVKTLQRRPVRLPIAFIFDCGFDDKMGEKERISLASQLTRSYSDNLKAPFQAHVYISSWNGQLKERFDTVLREHYKNWKAIEFTSEDFVHAAKLAEEAMKAADGGRLAGVFTKFDPQSQKPSDGNGQNEESSMPANPTASTSIDVLKSQGEVIYLTADSPNTLSELKPFSSYIIGGLVDKNRHKGICYKTACDRGIQTAKLPIGQYMRMQSRFVLATSHVHEIMIRYLECGDWGEAFMKVIPKRKGGKLKNEGPAETESVSNAGDEQDHNEASESEVGTSSDVDGHEDEPEVEVETKALS